MDLRRAGPERESRTGCWAGTGRRPAWPSVCSVHVSSPSKGNRCPRAPGQHADPRAAMSGEGRRQVCGGNGDSTFGSLGRGVSSLPGFHRGVDSKSGRFCFPSTLKPGHCAWPPLLLQALSQPHGFLFIYLKCFHVSLNRSSYAVLRSLQVYDLLIPQFCT